MKLKHISLCSIKLDFSPLRPLASTLPPISVGNVLISGFQKPLSQCLEVDTQLEAALADCYPHISLSELSRLYYLVECHSLQFSWEDYLKRLNLSWNSDMQKILLMLHTLPQPFQNWVGQKGCGQKDLMVLPWALQQYEEQQVHNFLNSFTALPFNKNQGCLVLEWSLELLSSNPEITNLLGCAKSTEQAFRQIKEIKFPHTENFDQQMSSKLKSISWPRRVFAQWLRQGDQSGVEVRFHIQNQHEFQKKLQELSKVGKDLSTKLWN